MSFIERMGSAQRQDERTERAENEPHRIPIREMLADERESKLFDAYLEHGDPATRDALKEIVLKFLNENNREPLTQEDTDLLHEETGKFFALKDRAKAAVETIRGSAEGVAHSSPELKKLIEMDPTVLDTALLGRMEEIGITQPEVLDNLEESFAKMAEAKESIDIGDERIAGYCKEYGFTEDEYFEALRKRAAGEPYAMEDLVKSKMGFFQKIKSKFVNYETFMREVEEDLDRRDYVDEKLGEIRESWTEIGSILHTTLFQNKEAAQVLEANLAHKRGPDERLTFFEAREGLNISPGTEAELQTGWTEYEGAHSGEPGYNRDEAMAAYAKEATARKMPKNKRGAMNGWLGTLFSSFVRTKIR